MRIRFRQRNVQRLAILSLVTALAAMVVLFGASELCACGPTSATSVDSDWRTAGPLTLTLTGPDICETTPAQGYSGRNLVDDGKGSYKYEWGPTVWYDVSEVPVTWEVVGGNPPITLLIDGESEDINGTYQGSSGTALVSCAQSDTSSFIDLLTQTFGYNEEPEVDSGQKTVQATVTDWTGTTATASLSFYVILETGGTGTILEGGKTYRIHGKLLTIPSGINFEIGGIESGHTTSYDLRVPGGPVVIALEFDTHREVVRFVQLSEDDYDSITSEETLSTLLDQLVASAGKLPSEQLGDTP